MPNFWPCKSLPKRSGHLDSSGVSGGHSVAYEDPDAHLHHHPLVRHHNMEVIVRTKTLIFILQKKIKKIKTMKSNYPFTFYISNHRKVANGNVTSTP